MQERNLNTITGVIVHCSYTPPDMDIGGETIRKWHVVERGWEDIGYHYIIRRDGSIELGRPLKYVGAHCSGQNYSTVGICLIGGAKRNKDGSLSSEFNYTDEQINTLKQLMKDHRDMDWYGHYEFNHNKTCPNFNVEALRSLGTIIIKVN